MKRKFADYSEWKKIKEKKFVKRYFNEAGFKGYVCLLTAVKVTEKLVVEKDGTDLVLMDDGYKWLEVYPENDKHIALSVAINEQNEILEWYFDVARNSGITADGLPYIDDLYLDVVLFPSGEKLLLDEDELEDALEKGDITQEDFDLAYRTANRLLKKLDGKIEELREFTYRYFSILHHSGSDNSA